MKPRHTQLQTLRVVAHHDRPGDGAMASDIAARLGISIDAAEKRLDRLGAAGLLEDKQIRWPHSQSGWITLAVLTEQGRAVLATDDERKQ